MTRPEWWDDADTPVFVDEDDRQMAKVAASREIVGFLLNVPFDHVDAVRVRSWFEQTDFPGVLQKIAHYLWDGTYDGDLQALVLRMIVDGWGDRIRNGVVLTDMYWDASFAGLEQAAWLLLCIRDHEREWAKYAAYLEVMYLKGEGPR